MYKPVWEPVSNMPYDGTVTRMQTPQGWLVRVIMSHGNGPAVSLFHVPDPEHDWVFEKEKTEEKVAKNDQPKRLLMRCRKVVDEPEEGSIFYRVSQF